MCHEALSISMCVYLLNIYVFLSAHPFSSSALSLPS